jgi:hypothetical protein
MVCILAGIVTRRWPGLLLLLVALPLRAQVTSTPSAPTAADVVTARLVVPSGCTISTITSVAGNLVRTDVHISGCLVGPPPYPEFENVTFGPLPAGAYTYEVFHVLNGAPIPHDTVPLLVQPLPVPSLDRAGLVLLAIGVLFAALFVMRT